MLLQKPQQEFNSINMKEEKPILPFHKKYRNEIIVGLVTFFFFVLMDMLRSCS